MEIDKNHLAVAGDEGFTKESMVGEERMMPQDVDAFFKHPLVAANQRDDGDAIALLHEYQTLYSAQTNRQDNSPIQVFDRSYNPKLSSASKLDLPLNTTSSDQNARSIGTAADPTLPSINVLSRSSLAQSHHIQTAPSVALNRQSNFSHVNLKSGHQSRSTGEDRFAYEKMNDPFVFVSETNSFRLDELPPLSLLNKASAMSRQSVAPQVSTRVHPIRGPFHDDNNNDNNNSNNSNNVQSPLLKQSIGAVESSAIDMTFQGSTKMANDSAKYFTSKQFFGDSDLIQMLEKQIPPEQFINPSGFSSTSGKNFQKFPSGIPSLPFPLPEVPLGYRLVITHLPITNDQEPDSKHITQLIIDNPIIPQSVGSSSGRTPSADDHRPREMERMATPERMSQKFTSEASDNSKDNLLKKCLEEADLLPLLSQEDECSIIAPPLETSSNRSSDFSLLQKEMNLSNWQSPTNAQSSTVATSYHDIPCSPPIKRNSHKGKQNPHWNHVSFIQKIEPDTSGFKFYLEACTSSQPMKDEDRVTYLNKGQYYGLVLRHDPTTPDFFSVSQTLKSVVMLVFRERLSVAEELKAWECWYSRQHSYKQRVLDIDSKHPGVNEGFSEPIFIEEISHNAASITWSKHTSVKLSLALNCLSTDFSHQKGIRGNPLHIQIDTYDGDNGVTLPCHRAYCQIKVFCDKGADRKIREEEKKRSRCPEEDNEHQESRDQSYFYSMMDLTTPPVLFSPSAPSQNFGHQFQLVEKKNPAVKRQNTDSMDDPTEPKRRATDMLLIFVREEKDKVFSALVVQPPTVECLCRAIQEKFLSASVKVENIYKESNYMKMKMDDVMVSSIADESTFSIRFQYNLQRSSQEETASCDVTLTEIRIHSN